MTRAPLLLHPLTIGSLALLLANDHWWKYAYPGVVTGKLSDVAGLVLVTMLLLAVIEVSPLSARGRRSVAIAGALVCMGAFAALKTMPVANELLSWPLGGKVLADWTDLVALSAVLLPLTVCRARLRPGVDRGKTPGGP